MAEPSVSICLATHQGERHLRELLASLLAQAAPPDEVVACDDASTDGTAELLERFAAGAPFEVRLLRQERRVGIIANFERVLADARCEVLLPCDQDDIWHADKVATMRRIFAGAARPAAAFHDSSLVGDAGEPLAGTLWSRSGLDAAGRSALSRGEGLAYLVAHPRAVGHALALGAWLKPLLLPFSARGPYDLWCSRLAAAAGPVVPVDRRLVAHRVHPAAAVGVPGVGTLRHRLDRSRAAAWWLDDAAGLEDLEARLAERRPAALTPAVRAAIGDKVAHLRRRAGFAGAAGDSTSSAAAGASRMRLAAAIAAEAASGRYHRYSNGLPSAAADLLAIARPQARS